MSWVQVIALPWWIPNLYLLLLPNLRLLWATTYQWISLIYHALNLLSLPSEPPGKPSWNPNNLATWCEQPTHWKRLWCWERLKAEGEEGDRGWDGWMAPPTQRMWAWESSGRWWRIGKSGVLQSMGSQRVRHDLMTEQQQKPPFSIPNVPLLIFTISVDGNFFPPRCWGKILFLSILPIPVNVLVISFRSTF